MNVGFFGIQYSFGLQQSAVNPIYDFLGASPDELPLLNLAGPLTGLLIQPIIGALSDKTWSPKFGGRRKPYFFIGALICSIALFLFPFSSSLWMAAGLLWILDAGNNTAMEPYRAFIADKLDESQQPLGFQAQSFFTGFGQTLANVSLFIFPLIFIGTTGKLPTWVFASFFLGAVCSIGSVWWSSYTTKEIPPTDEELQKIKSEKLSVFTPFIDIASAIKDMPRVMWILALVYLFQWYALFCYWQNSSKVVAKNSFEWRLMTDKENEIKKSYSEFKETLNKNDLYKSSTDSISKINNSNSTSSYATIYATWKDKIDYPKKLSEEETKTLSFIEANDKKYEKAVSWTGLINGWYNIVTFLVAFSLVWMARKYIAKIVHMSCLLIAGFGFIAFTLIENKYLLFPPSPDLELDGQV